METKDIVKAMKDLVTCYESLSADDSDFAIEIKMWRRYFLKKEMKPYSEAKKAAIEHSFMITPCETMLKRDPKEILKQFQLDYDNVGQK